MVLYTLSWSKPLHPRWLLPWKWSFFTVVMQCGFRVQKHNTWSEVPLWHLKYCFKHVRDVPPERSFLPSGKKGYQQNWQRVTYWHKKSRVFACRCVCNHLYTCAIVRLNRNGNRSLDWMNLWLIHVQLSQKLPLLLWHKYTAVFRTTYHYVAVPSESHTVKEILGWLFICSS